MSLENGLKEELWSVLDEECLCRGCPSYVSCGEMGGYCFRIVGRSKCIKAKRGCECSACPITKMEGLTGTYYCIYGPAKVASGAKRGAARPNKKNAAKARKRKK